jgi:hypothetical protein
MQARVDAATIYEADLFAEISELAQERAERLRRGDAAPDHDLKHLAILFFAALRPDDWPGDIDDSFPAALGALTRTAQ